MSKQSEISIDQSLNEKSNQLGNILLPSDADFIITRVGSEFSSRINITHRCPRRIGGTHIELIATTSLDAMRLSGLRVEEIDGQYFVINDQPSIHEEQIRFTVTSEEIGHQIIKAVIDEFAPSIADGNRKDNLDLPEEYWRINQIAVEFSPLIMISCAVLLTLSASYWLLLR
jgi:hypothetical protein